MINICIFVSYIVILIICGGIANYFFGKIFKKK